MMIKLDSESRTWMVLGLLACLWLGSCGCGEQEEPKVRLSGALASKPEPTLLFEGFHMVSTLGLRREWDFSARAAQVFERERVARAQDIKVVYWRQDRPVSTLTAKRGFIQTDTNNLRAEQDVVMVSDNGVTLRTQWLAWDQRLRKIYTDQPVVIERPGSILRGVGLEADSELKHLEILSQVDIKVRSLKDLKASLTPTPGPAAAP